MVASERWRSIGLLVALSCAACAPRLSVGAACSSAGDCASELVCNLGRCRAECRVQRDCPIGALCVVDPATDVGSCSLPDDIDCGTRDELCAAGLLCIAGACVNACREAVDCPGGSRCEPGPDGRARCVRADGADAGDAGALLDAEADAGCHGPGCDRVAQVSVGAVNVCARTLSGAIHCWGRGVAVGAGAITHETCGGASCETRPVQVVRLNAVTELEEPVSGATDVSVGEQFACAVIDAGVWCWGLAGATGTGDPGGGDLALRVRRALGGFAVGVRDVSCLRDGAIALLEDGTYLGWGGDAGGLMGTSAAASFDTAVVFAVAAMPLDAERLVVGGFHASVLGASGGASSWGWNDWGQLGRAPLPREGLFDAAAGMVGTVGTITDLSAGLEHGCAIIDGDAWCWGQHDVLGSTGPPANDCSAILDARCTISPQRVYRSTASARFDSLGASSTATFECAVDAVGAVWCWGPSPAIGTMPPYLEPRQITLPGPASAVSVGTDVACAILNGDVYCWGENGFGQLGRGPGADDPMPGRVEFPAP